MRTSVRRARRLGASSGRGCLSGDCVPSVTNFPTPCRSPRQPLGDEQLHIHSMDGPEDCFGCKCAYWRSRKHGIRVTYPYGQDQFHSVTVKERTDDMLRRARAHGIEPEPVGYTHF